MIYDITDIINETHQFSCLIEGGRSARLAQLKDSHDRTGQNRHLPIFFLYFILSLTISLSLRLLWTKVWQLSNMCKIRWWAVNRVKHPSSCFIVHIYTDADMLYINVYVYSVYMIYEAAFLDV